MRRPHGASHLLRQLPPNSHVLPAPTLAFTRSELATKDETGLTLAERVLLRLSDAKDPMPPALYGVVPPSDAERRVISDWLTADMPGGECDE